MKAWLQRTVHRFLPAGITKHLVRFAMPDEHRFFFGNLPTPAVPKPNLLHLTLNKAASQHIARLLAALAPELDYRPIWANRYAFLVDVPFIDHMNARALRANPNLLAPKGLLLAAIGRPVSDPDLLAATRQIIVVRDPRDLVTSDFFSITEFHPEPVAADKRAAFQAQRAAARLQGIDAFVASQIADLRRMFEAYRAISERPTCLATLRFEDFRDDYGRWLVQLESALGLAPDPVRARRMAAFAPTLPTTERRGRKIRSGRSGQFRDALRPATVAAMNAALHDLLEHFGYPVD